MKNTPIHVCDIFLFISYMLWIAPRSLGERNQHNNFKKEGIDGWQWVEKSSQYSQSSRLSFFSEPTPPLLYTDILLHVIVTSYVHYCPGGLAYKSVGVRLATHLELSVSIFFPKRGSWGDRSKQGNWVWKCPGKLHKILAIWTFISLSFRCNLQFSFQNLMISKDIFSKKQK